MLIADRYDESPRISKLFYQRLGDTRASGSDNNGIIRAIFRPADGTIIQFRPDIIIVQLIKNLSSLPPIAS